MDLNSILYGGQAPQQSTPQTFVPQVPAGVASAPVAPAPQQMQLPPPVAAQQEAPAQGFMEKLRTNPAVAQTMMMMGARLMQGPKRGQDELGALGDAAMIGLTAHNMLQQNKKDEEVMGREQARKDQLAAADLEASRASTESTKLKTSQAAELFPETKLKVQEEIKAFKAAGKVSEAKALAENWKNDPKRLAEAWALDVKKTQAQISADNARAGASAAQADNSRASAEQTRAETADPQKYMRPGAAATGEKPADYNAMFAKFLSSTYMPMETPEERTAAYTAFEESLTNMQRIKSGMGGGQAGGSPAPKDTGQPTAKVATEADIIATQKANPGMTLDQVRTAIKARGFTLPN